MMTLGMTVGVLSGCQLPGQQSEAPPVRGEGGETIRVSQADIHSAKDAPEPKILPKTRFAAGRLFESSGRWDRAVEQYRKAVADDAGYVEAYDRLGVILGYLGEHEEAERSLRRGVQLRPKSAELRNNLGFELILQRKWAEAEIELRQALELQRTFDRAQVNLGLVLAAKGDFDGAQAAYRKVLPESDAIYNMGLAYRAHRREADARAAFARVLTINPNFVAARKQLASMGGVGAGGEAKGPTAA
ncbi:MAG: tetratricopeptide repeat protein, partial [Phycisphaerales bacterium]|nr:tetratricopeptide repeat protein [Phycisphaerales bacterium]